jgi:hypothetical protein
MGDKGKGKGSTKKASTGTNGGLRPHEKREHDAAVNKPKP